MTRAGTQTDRLAAVVGADVVAAAAALVGCALVGRSAAGVIVEAEAYHQREAACHGHRGTPTPRTEKLFGAPGTHYVYFTYGMHWCTNIVCEPAGVAAAVLVRALQPIVGEGMMRERREARRRMGASTLRDRDLCSGPARLVQALGIEASDSGRPALGSWPAGDPVAALEQLAGAVSVPLVLPRNASLLEDMDIDVRDIASGPRIGITVATDLPWRFAVRGSRWLSRSI